MGSEPAKRSLETAFSGSDTQKGPNLSSGYVVDPRIAELEAKLAHEIKRREEVEEQAKKDLAAMHAQLPAQSKGGYVANPRAVEELEYTLADERKRRETAEGYVKN